MSDTEETTTAIRKTRSGRAVKTPAKPKPASVKAGGRKTRKKVVVMEVEVTDDEDMEQTEESIEPVGKKAKLDEDKLLEAASDGEAADDNHKNEDVLLNSGDEADKDKKEDEADKDKKEDELVMNDIEMLEEIIHTNEKITETVKKSDDTEAESKNGTTEELEKPVEKKVSEKNGVEKETAPTKANEENGEPKVEVKSVMEVNSSSTEVDKKEEAVKDGEEKAEIKEVKEAVKVEEPKEEAKIEDIKESKEVEKTEAIIDKEEVAKNKTTTENKDVDKTEPVKENEEPKKSLKDDTKEKVAEEEKVKIKEDAKVEKKEDEVKKVINQNGDPEAENISDDELPGVPVAKVPETEEVSDEELPGPKRAELPADTEVVSEDELPTTKKDGEEDEVTPAKKEGGKRKLSGADYDPTSPTSENEAPTKKSKEDKDDKEKEGESKPAKPKKLPELDKYWKAVNDDPTDFTGWTYLLQYVDQENDMEAAREAYDAFLSHYPYCYGYWRKYADYEKRKGNKKKCEEVFERGLKAIPLSVDLWIHYLTYVKSTRGEDEEYVRSQFERALAACGLEFRSDRLWDSYIKWETEGKRFQKVTALFDRLLTTPTQGYTTHFDNFQEHVSSNTPNKILEVDEFLALRKEVRNLLKDDEKAADNADMPPGDEDSKLFSSDEETKCIRERIVSIRRKSHKNTVNAVTARWNFEEGIKRPYFHVKPLERCQLKNWQEYLDYEIEQGDRVRIIVLFERCLIACALYEEFWLKFVHYLESLNDAELQSKIRDVYERACTIHHLKKPNLHLQWAIFEEASGNVNRAAEILVNLEKQVPNVLQVAYRRINLERRRSDNEKCAQLFEHYIGNSKNKMISSTIAIKYSRFCQRILKDFDKAQEALRTAITKDPNNPRLYLQLIDLLLQKPDVKESDVCAAIDEFLEKESADPDQKALFAQRKLEYLEDFGSNVESVRAAHDLYQKYQKLCKESGKKKEAKSDSTSSSKKEKPPSSSTSQSTTASYPNYNYGTSSTTQPTYPYSGTQQGQYNYPQYGQGDQQYQYQNWQYPQENYGGYNQWGGYGGGYSY